MCVCVSPNQCTCGSNTEYYYNVWLHTGHAPNHVLAISFMYLHICYCIYNMYLQLSVTYNIYMQWILTQGLSFVIGTPGNGAVSITCSTITFTRLL